MLEEPVRDRSGFPLARGGVRALLVLALAGAPGLPGCLVPAPQPDDWLAVGFRTPAQSFQTLQTAIAGKRPDLEYRCLSEGFKGREGLTELTWREFRSVLLKERPWIRQIARAEIDRVEALGPGRARLFATIPSPLGGLGSTPIAVDLVAEEFWELRVEGELADDGFAPLASTLRIADHAQEITATVPLRGGLGLDALTGIAVGREWKIDGFGAPAAARP